jgi:hypothetical protein
MKLNVWIVLAILVVLAFFLAPRASSFLYDSGGEYNVAWPRAYANWMGLDGRIDVPTGAMCDVSDTCTL